MTARDDEEAQEREYLEGLRYEDRHPQRTCANCGHERDVHGAYRTTDHRWRCNFRIGLVAPRCSCSGFVSVAEMAASTGEVF